MTLTPAEKRTRIDKMITPQLLDAARAADDDLVKRLMNKTVDYDETNILDGAEPRVPVTCGEIREIAFCIENITQKYIMLGQALRDIRLCDGSWNDIQEIANRALEGHPWTETRANWRSWHPQPNSVSPKSAGVMTPDELATINAGVALVPELQDGNPAFARVINPSTVQTLIAALALVGKLVEEVEKLKAICRDINDIINTSPYLFQEPIDHQKVLDMIEDLAFSGYDPAIA